MRAQDEHVSYDSFEDGILYFHNSYAHPAVREKWMSTFHGVTYVREYAEHNEIVSRTVEDTLAALSALPGDKDALLRTLRQLRIAVGESCTREQLLELPGAQHSVLRLALIYCTANGLAQNPDITAELMGEMLGAGHGPVEVYEDALAVGRPALSTLLHRVNPALLAGEIAGMSFALRDVLRSYTYSTEVISSLTSCEYLTVEQGREVQDYFTDRLVNGPHPVSLAEYGGATKWLPPSLVDRLLTHTNSFVYADQVSDGSGLLVHDTLDDSNYFLRGTFPLWCHRFNDGAFCSSSELVQEMLPRTLAAGISFDEFLRTTLPRTVNDDVYVRELLCLLDGEELGTGEKSALLEHVALYAPPGWQSEVIPLFASHGVSIPTLVARNSWWCWENTETIELRSLAQSVNHALWRDACEAFAERFANMAASDVGQRWEMFIFMAPTFAYTYPELIDLISETFFM
jgi:hypothetical protein